MNKEDVVIGKEYRVIMEFQSSNRAKIGDIVVIEGHTSRSCGDFSIKNKTNHHSRVIFASQIEPLMKDYTNLEQGDIVYMKFGDEYEYQGKIGKVHIITRTDHTQYIHFYSEKQFKKIFTIKQEEPVEEIEELTVDEISKRLGKTIKVVK